MGRSPQRTCLAPLQISAAASRNDCIQSCPAWPLITQQCCCPPPRHDIPPPNTSTHSGQPWAGWTEGVGEVQTADSTVSPTSIWDRDISKWVSSQLLLNSSGYLYLRAGLHRLARRGQGKRVTTGYCSGLVARCSLTIDVELRAGRRSQQQ